VFWDLGCGTGKGLGTVALNFPQLSSVNGVEFLEDLCASAQTAVETLIGANVSAFPPINVHCGDMLVVDWWTSADIVYMASLLFPDQLIQSLTEN
jgi:tRNA G46 methylase TrmB